MFLSGTDHNATNKTTALIPLKPLLLFFHTSRCCGPMSSHGVVIKSRTKKVDAAVAETLPLSAPTGQASTLAPAAPEASSPSSPPLLLVLLLLVL